MLLWKRVNLFHFQIISHSLRERETEKEGWEGEVHLQVESTCFRQEKEGEGVHISEVLFWFDCHPSRLNESWCDVFKNCHSCMKPRYTSFGDNANYATFCNDNKAYVNSCPGTTSYRMVYLGSHPSISQQGIRVFPCPPCGHLSPNLCSYVQKCL